MSQEGESLGTRLSETHSVSQEGESLGTRLSETHSGYIHSYPGAVRQGLC